MGLMDLQQEMLDRQAERDRELRDFEARETRRQELHEKLLALMPVLLKTLTGETSGGLTEAITDRDPNVIPITRAQSAREDRLKAQAFKKIDGMSGEEIAQLLQSRDPDERRMFKRLFDMYCEWKGNKGK